MQTDSSRTRSLDDTRQRILDVALDVLGRNPEAGMGDIAGAVGVVRRTVYGHFPTRRDLVHTLALRAVAEMRGVLEEVLATGGAADQLWADFIGRLWPMAHRYRVLVALRRGECGTEIHALLAPVDEMLAGLVENGQSSDVFGRHLPPQVLGQVAFAAVFAIADNEFAGHSISTGAAAITSLLILGVPGARARALVDASR